MSEKYFAALMKKTLVGENNYIYTVESIVAGDIDEKTRELITTNGEKYKCIDDFTDFENTNEYYTNIIEINRITEIYEQQYNFYSAFLEYESRCKDIVYFVTKKANSGYIILTIDKRPYLTAMEQIQANPEAYEEEAQQNQLSEHMTTDKIEDDEDPFIEEIKNLVDRIVAGDFSSEELKGIKYRLVDQKDELEAAIDAIDLHIEALEEKTDCPPTPTQVCSSVKIIDIDDIFDKVTKVLVAQDQPARRLIVELSRLDKMRKKVGILLTGESGVGKTLLMSLLAKHLDRPILQIDSTLLTAAGYVGDSLEQKLWELYEDCGYDLAKVERAIVFFDEIDKKGSEKKSDISGQAVLNMLLKFLDGASYTARKSSHAQAPEKSVRINTSNMLIVAGGAFLDVYNTAENKTAGFNSESISEKKEKPEPTITDFVKKAMMPKEFMARVPLIIRLNSLNENSIKSILLDSEDSALKIQEEVFGEAGVKLTTKDGYISAVAKKALDEKTGARGLNKIIMDTTWRAYDSVISNQGIYEEVILTADTVENPSSFQLVKKQSKN